MKNNLSPFIVILVLLLGLPTQSINAQKIMVLEDAFVQGGENSNDVMVNTQPKALKVFNSKADSKYARITYLKFKLPKRIKKHKNNEASF